MEKINDIRCAHNKIQDINKIAINPDNDNKHPEEQVERLRKMILDKGQRLPITVSKRSGYLVKGHCTLEAIKRLGWTKIACDYQDFDSLAEEIEHMTGDNEIARWSEMDMEGLQKKLETIPEINIDMLGIDGFTQEKLSEIEDISNAINDKRKGNNLDNEIKEISNIEKENIDKEKEMRVSNDQVMTCPECGFKIG